MLYCSSTLVAFSGFIRICGGYSGEVKVGSAYVCSAWIFWFYFVYQYLVDGTVLVLSFSYDG
jgi:TM2 domain-containing membrane protein YozV